MCIRDSLSVSSFECHHLSAVIGVPSFECHHLSAVIGVPWFECHHLSVIIWVPSFECHHLSAIIFCVFMSAINVLYRVHETSVWSLLYFLLSRICTSASDLVRCNAPLQCLRSEMTTRVSAGDGIYTHTLGYAGYSRILFYMFHVGYSYIYVCSK